MATRPIFIPLKGRRSHDGTFGRGPLVERVDIDIPWHGGFSLVQKQKNIEELHRKAGSEGISPILEVSTKSMQEVGVRLSAFSLKISVNGEKKSLESTYQAAKVFSQSGRHPELADMPPGLAKKKVRELGRGEIIAFEFEGQSYETEPKNAFYDWLYLRAIYPFEDWIKRNLNYAAYSDIEFTPSKSINCQARAVAEFHALSMRGQAIVCSRDYETFRRLLQMAQREDAV